MPSLTLLAAYALIAAMTSTTASPLAGIAKTNINPTIHARDEHNPITAPGWCTFHIVQYQRADPAKDPFTFDLTLYDAANTKILFYDIDPEPLDSLSKVPANNDLLQLHTDLPQPFVILTPSQNGDPPKDSDPVSFEYAGTVFNSLDTTHCNMGQLGNDAPAHPTYGYEDGSRSGDCGFQC